MKFLQKLAVTGGVIGFMVASSLNSRAGHFGFAETTVENEAGTGLLNPLGQQLSISNPYTNADKPFTIVEAAYDKAEALATSVTCGGLTWTEGDFMGRNSNGDLRTAIVNGRIYIRNGSQIAESWGVLYGAQDRRFSHTDDIDRMLHSCVNNRDPSTAPESFLGAVTNDGIYCNGKLIKDKMLLGTYLGGERPVPVATRLYAHVNRTLGILRITAWRDENGNPNNYDGFNSSLIPGILAREQGSFMESNPGFYEKRIFDGCFYTQLPVYPDGQTPTNPTPNCTTLPVINSITGISQTGITFNYGGQGISDVKWRVKRTSDNAEVASGTSNATTATISYAPQQYGNYRLEVEGNNCISATVTRDFSIEQPVVVTPNCNTLPVINSIVSVSQTGLTFNYSGQGITAVKWRVKRASNNTEVASGTANATTSTISYAPQQYGDYRLELEGNNCISATVIRDFRIEQPPVIGTPDCVGGPALTDIINISTTGAQVNFAGSNLSQFSWRILNLSNQVFESGKTEKLSSKSANIPFTLSSGLYTFELTAEDCKAPAAVTRTFVVNGTDNRESCDRGPNLETIVNPGKNQLDFRFDGNGVYAIDWKLKSSNGQVMAESRVRPQSNTPSIQFGTLADGTYTLEISGGTCKSAVTSSTFQVGTALPIYTANFKGKAVEQGVELSWDVVSEKNGEGFEILRLDNKAQSSQVIGKVALTDSKIGSYSFVDKAPALGTNYYQLKQIDLDGTFTRSNIIAVTPASITGTVVAPNPARDYVDVQFSSRTSGNADLEIYNISGMKLQSSKIQIVEGKNIHRVGVSKLYEGNYFIKVSHNGETSKLRFVKVN